VVLAMPSQQAAARGERLEYDFVERRIVLDSNEQVWLSQRNSEIHARSLQYQFAPAGRLGRVVAAGAGWLRAQMDEKPDQVLEARWMDRLLVRPHEQNQLISLTGGAQVKFQGIGRMNAQEVHLWLIEQPGVSPRGLPRLYPDRLLARDNVRIDSAQLSGRVEQLEAWFEPAAPAAQTQLVCATPATELLPAAVPSALLVPVGSGASPRASLASSPPDASHAPPGISHHCLRVPPAASDGWGQPAGRLVAVSPAGGPAAGPVAVPSSASPSPPRALRHFEISGRLLRTRIRYSADQGTELAEVTVEDNVQLRQTPTWESEELRLSGQRLHALRPQRSDGEVTVTGQPARLSAKGLELVGPNVHLNRGTNRMWIEGAGRMQFPLNRQLDGRPLDPPGVMAVEWQDGMVFDGQAARFETAVFVQTFIAQAWRQRLWTETLEVRLARRLDFADPQHPPTAPRAATGVLPRGCVDGEP